MYEYLKPKDGPVVDGLEFAEVVYAKDQPQYIPLRTLVSHSPEGRAISRWTLTAEQRKAVAGGADLFLELLTFGGPLQPIRMAVSDGNLDPTWVRVCLLDEPVLDARMKANTLENEVLPAKVVPPGPPNPPRPPNDHPVG